MFSVRSNSRVTTMKVLKIIRKEYQKLSLLQTNETGKKEISLQKPRIGKNLNQILKQSLLTYNTLAIKQTCILKYDCSRKNKVILLKITDHGSK